MTVAREDLALEAASGRSCPGTFAFRPRKAPITSRNLAAMAPFHNYPLGQARRQSLGRGARAPDHERPLAVPLLPARQRPHRSGRRQPQGHRPHVDLRTDRIRQDGLHRLSDRDARAARVTTQVIFDKDRGLEILVRALGGEYLPLKSGTPTGFNPAAAARDTAQRRVPEGLAARLARTRDEGGDPAHARAGGSRPGAAGNAGPGPSARRLSRLIEFLDPDRSGRAPCAAGALVRSIARRLRVGVRQPRGHAVAPPCRARS